MWMDRLSLIHWKKEHLYEDRTQVDKGDYVNGSVLEKKVELGDLLFYLLISWYSLKGYRIIFIRSLGWVFWSLISNSYEENCIFKMKLSNWRKLSESLCFTGLASRQLRSTWMSPNSVFVHKFFFKKARTYSKESFTENYNSFQGVWNEENKIYFLLFRLPYRLQTESIWTFLYLQIDIRISRQINRDPRKFFRQKANKIKTNILKKFFQMKMKDKTFLFLKIENFPSKLMEKTFLMAVFFDFEKNINDFRTL